MKTIARDTSARVSVTQEDRRFAELTVRSGLEPELAQRYAADPVAVLAEFGLSAGEPIYLAGLVGDADTVLIEELDVPGVGFASNCTGSWSAALVG
ncbi:hypothetical protein [Streptomyces sp. NRRL WC-3742]|uniref:hypothetical protein n=1 Tax=Streptomyces sp. NRRL WC-3742 TaxID=1463934 RepID=UPI0004C7384A|nr:hypothetical protein [Streptomyces sp. NRRL WC-3742]